jgi:hypothetical protein
MEYSDDSGGIVDKAASIGCKTVNDESRLTIDVEHACQEDANVYQLMEYLRLVVMRLDFCCCLCHCVDERGVLYGVREVLMKEVVCDNKQAD